MDESYSIDGIKVRPYSHQSSQSLPNSPNKSFISDIHSYLSDGNDGNPFSISDTTDTPMILPANSSGLNSLKLKTKSKKPKRSKYNRNVNNKKTRHISSSSLCMDRDRDRTRIQKRKRIKSKTKSNELKKMESKPIQLWTISEVCQWIAFLCEGQFREHSSKFKSAAITGQKLYKMNTKILKNTLHLTDPLARRHILAALERLRHKKREEAKHRHSHMKARMSTRHLFPPQQRSNNNKSRNDSASVTQKAHKDIFMTAVKKRKRRKSADYGTNSNSKIDAVDDFLNGFDLHQEWQNKRINFVGSTILEQTPKFTMIELKDKRIVYVLTTSVKKWSTNDCCAWISKIANCNFKPFVSVFQSLNIDGKALLNMNDNVLQNNVHMEEVNMRAGFLHEIKLLKKEVLHQNNKSTRHKSNTNTNTNDNNLESNRAQKPFKPRQRRSSFSNITQRKVPMLAQISKDDGFLGERMFYQSTSRYFEQRKSAKPVEIGQTVEQIGVNADFENPKWSALMEENAKHGDLFADRPAHTCSGYYRSKMDEHISKSKRVSEFAKPMGWTPIEYTDNNDNSSSFLQEHMWFASSSIKWDTTNFSRMIMCLPPQKLRLLESKPLPTGLETKLNWLKTLRDMVKDEARIIAMDEEIEQLNENGVNTGVAVAVAVAAEADEDNHNNNDGNKNENENENANETGNESENSVDIDDDEEDVAAEVIQKSVRNLSPHINDVYRHSKNIVDSAEGEGSQLRCENNRSLLSLKKQRSIMSRKSVHRRKLMSMASVRNLNVMIGSISMKQQKHAEITTVESVVG